MILIDLARETRQVKNIGDNVMSENFDVSVFFPIYGQFRENRKQDFERVVCKTYMLVSSNLSSYKNRKKN